MPWQRRRGPDEVQLARLAAEQVTAEAEEATSRRSLDDSRRLARQLESAVEVREAVSHDLFAQTVLQQILDAARARELPP
jgi:hypothetical protein